MNTSTWLQAKYLPIPLIALMTLTRYHHFGDALHLPDASLAVFFFAGFYRKPSFFAFLLALAGLIDYAAIAHGTSGWCLSPAYAFLIPTYGVMWLTGRFCSKFEFFDAIGLSLNLCLIYLSSSAAFLISNASFYFFSGRFDSASLSVYFTDGIEYYLPYVGFTLLYAAAGFVAVKLLTFLTAAEESGKSA